MLNILAILFTQTELTPELQMDIFFVLKTMIKTYFKDDEKKIRELLKMIMETYSENEKKELIKLIRIAIGPIEEKEYKYLSLYENTHFGFGNKTRKQRQNNRKNEKTIRT